MGRGTGRHFTGFTCLKFVFFIFNVVFWLLGCAVLGIGIWLHIEKGSYASVAPSFDVLSATSLCISAGAIVLVVGFFGCCGAIMENSCMLLTYFLLVVVIFVMEIIAGIIAFAFRDEVGIAMKRELHSGLKTKYNMSDQHGLKQAWDHVQTNLQCCGVYNYTDWYYAKPWENKRYVPDSCCKVFSQDCGKTHDKKLWYNRGCYEELKFWFQSHLYIVGVVGITVGVIQILGLIASMALFCCLRNEKYY